MKCPITNGFRYFGALLCLLSALTIYPLWTLPISAASGELDPNGDGSVGSWSTTGTNYYTEVDEGVRTPDVPDTTDYISGTAAATGNIFLDMDTITSDIYFVTRLRVRLYHNDGSNGRIHVQIFESDESTPLTSEISVTRSISTDAWYTANFAGLQLTSAELSDMRVRVRSTKPGAGVADTVYVYAMYITVTYDPPPRFRQAAFRFFNNTDSTDVGTVLAAQDANIVLASSGYDFRLRVLVDAALATIPLDNESFKLQYVDIGSGTCVSPSGGTPATYTDVTGSTLIAYNDNVTPADGATLTANADDPVHDTDTTQIQTYEETNDFSNSVNAIPLGDSAMWDFSLTDNSGTTTTAYCLRLVKADGTTLLGYDQYAMVTTWGGVLGVDIVDAAGVPVALPSRNMTDATFGFDCQTTTGRIGVTSQRIRVDNGTSNPSWSLAIAATGGLTDNWDDGGSNSYDFNDPGGSPAGCADGGDIDSLAGQLSFDFSAAIVTTPVGCSTTGISFGSNTAFNQGTADSVTLAYSSSSSDTGCYWDFQRFDLAQQIPPEQLDDSYSINLTITVTAV